MMTKQDAPPYSVVEGIGKGSVNLQTVGKCDHDIW